MDDIKPKKIVEDNVPQYLRKAYVEPDIRSHTVLTDNVFEYVEFFFKKNRRKLKNSAGKKLSVDYMLFWQQAANFYNATKRLPIESAPLVMYYCMLNATKAYITYYSVDHADEAINNMQSHGVNECKNQVDKTDLSEIKIKHRDNGVFPYFSKIIDGDFLNAWGEKNPFSVKELMETLAFIHNPYISTYNIVRKNERFIPVAINEPPTYYICSDNKIHLIAHLQRSYFKKDAKTIPKDINDSIPKVFDVLEDVPFTIISKEGFEKTEIKEKSREYRKMFSSISGNKRIWYLKRFSADCKTQGINELSKIFAITHRLSEIVRYKPEEFVKLLYGRENWIVHEFLNHALDQFIDELACEITKKEIMPTRIK